jgi:hypothetical protein
MDHGSIQLSADQRAELQALLNQHVGAASLHRVCQVSAGANANSHHVAYDARGRQFGLKGVTRVARGAAMEVMLSRLAVELGAPNAQASVLLPQGAWSYVSDKEMAIIPWLPASKPLNALDPTERQPLADTASGFAHQFGQWTAFALLLGIGGRHGGNWVWAPKSHALCMIDLEEALQPTVNVLQFGVYKDIVPTPLEPQKHVEAVASGMAAMYEAFRDRSTLVDETLRAAGTPFMSAHANADPHALADEWARAFGFRS